MPVAGFPEVEVKLAPGGRFVAEREIAPGTPGFDALMMKARSAPTGEVSEPGTTSEGGPLMASACTEMMIVTE